MIDATGIGRASGRDILMRGTAVHGTNGAGSMGRDRETSGGGGPREGTEVRVDPISDYTFDQLHGIAKSQKHFAVLLVQNLFTREQLNTPNANMADHSDGPELVAWKQGQSVCDLVCFDYTSCVVL